MDNLTHSVAGLAAGELLHRSLPQEPVVEQHRLRRRLLLISCWLASNFPDLDLVLTPLLPAPLGYLLHHRGHTHTLLYALPQAMLVWGMIWLLWPAARRLLQTSRPARIGLALSLSIGFGLHMLMDYLNSYGIHPFHPFDSRWLYGDMVFILEPFFWVALGIPMAMTVQRLGLRMLFIGTLVATLLYFTVTEYLAWSSLAVLLVMACALGRGQYKVGARGKSALIFAVVLSISFVGVQGFFSAQAKHAVILYSLKKDPASRVLDASMSSFPTNPFCWAFVSVESNESAGTYRLRRGIVSAAPHILPVAQCPASLSERPAQTEVTAATAILFQEQGKLSTLRAMNHENCHFNAWLRFARAPSVNEEQASDLRFSAGPRGNFTTMNFEDFKNRECSRYIPHWDFPRMDLLTPPVRPQNAHPLHPVQ